MDTTPPDTPTSEETLPDGFGCRPAAIALAIIVAFVVVGATIGISLGLRTGCDAACEAVGFTLYAGALPVSGIFAAVAGDLPLAWPLDATLWIIVSLSASRVAEQRRIGVPRVALSAIGIALIYGFVLSFFIEAAV